MNMTTISSRDFNQDTSRAKKAALKGPVFITDRGKPAHVLLKEYQRLTGEERKIAEALAPPDPEPVDFEPPHLHIGLRPADFS